MELPFSKWSLWRSPAWVSHLGGALLCQNHRERCYPYSAQGVLQRTAYRLGQHISDNYTTFTTPEYPVVF
ncbi:Hypothetical protein FKW44_010730 [Caligus rogercresseyi]|uniref:Uncharacterized protein n=1 Tax=Caligus rogercresseyi TaxID=217165 RepID=A0A7T8HH00_CALRO|nr:Hypothetical protein FKW44_010730 [Caligus rogercresseyi]